MTELEGRRRTPPGWSPAFPGQRPPVGVNNTLAVTHGAYSDRQVLPVAGRLLDELLPTLPAYLQEARYAPAVRAYALVLARIERVERWLEAQADKGGIPEIDGDGEVRSAMRLLLQLEAQADRHRQGLGLTPLASARLGKDVAQQQVSLAQLWAQAAHEQPQEPGGGPLAGGLV